MSINKGVFLKQMVYLRRHDYQVMSLEEAVEAMRTGRRVPDNRVALTFDDGHRDFYEIAYPIIKTYRYNVTAFIFTDLLEKESGYLTWSELKELQKDSLVEIGAHSISHKPLTRLSHSEAEREIVMSKSLLEERLGKPVTLFAYPFGALNESIKEVVKESGYTAAVGTAYRRGEFKDEDVYILKRVFVSKLSRYPFIYRFMLSGYYVPARELILRILNIRTPRDAMNY
ncbi:MAG: hypothetical protein A2987_01455 [Omnitrophica bacterium RIFCSPLOWO2_01_FULL_45_10]|nr:MAG: hypothetical protein A2987_01455 [Omnitrophica bacterium RIFCSPLOWO2_01_FULL_45_10]